MPAPRPRRLIATAVVAAVASAAGCGSEDGPAAERPVPDGPNIVLITSDDQALDSFNRRAMPQTTRLLVDEGTVPEDFVVTTPFCCPSRASLLTGQYGHNNGVLANRYQDLRDPESTLPVWLHDAGYTTVHLGKYLNNYEKVAKDVGPAPGWDGWATVVGASYYDYELYGADGATEYGTKPGDYLARVITERAVGAIEDNAEGDRPLFLQADYYAPHPDPSDDERCGDSALPDSRDTDLFEGARAPRPPSFNEQDTSDKPPFLQRSQLDAKSVERIDRRFACQLASMRSVDRGIAAIVRALERTGELDRTVIAYMSDNGVVRGHHAIAGGKHVAYQETLRVPVALRVPPELLDGARAPSVLEGPAANIDLAPTFLDLAGAKPCTAQGECRVMDGRSLVPALAGAEPLDPRRVRLIEIDEEANPEKLVGPCRYRGMLSGELFYLEHEIAQSLETGECVPVDDRELYDLAADPYELENLLPPDGGDASGVLADDLARVLRELHDCEGIAGRDPEPPVGVSYCE
ncbi:MAG: sulfatase family protein [Solirubrobacterales bacterium]